MMPVIIQAIGVDGNGRNTQKCFYSFSKTISLYFQYSLQHVHIHLSKVLNVSKQVLYCTSEFFALFAVNDDHTF